MSTKLQKYTKETVIQEADLFLQGYPIRRISKTLGVPRSTISWHLIKPLKDIDSHLWVRVRERLNKYAKNKIRRAEDQVFIDLYHNARIKEDCQ